MTNNLIVEGTMGHTLQLEKTEGCIRDSRKFTFSHRVVGQWNNKWMYLVSMPSKGDLTK